MRRSVANQCANTIRPASAIRANQELKVRSWIATLGLMILRQPFQLEIRERAPSGARAYHKPTICSVDPQRGEADRCLPAHAVGSGCRKPSVEAPGRVLYDAYLSISVA